MQEISEAHKDLLRNLIDQQLWLSKGKELGITGETELVNRLNEIRKQYNLATMEDLEKAAQEQGVSFEDFKANIRNQIITQEVMRAGGGPQDLRHPGRGAALLRGSTSRTMRSRKASARGDSGFHRAPAPSVPDQRARSRTIHRSWPRPRPRPTISRPSSTPAATSASWPELQRWHHGGRRRRSGPVQARPTGQGLRRPDLRAQGRASIPSRFAPSRDSSF